MTLFHRISLIKFRPILREVGRCTKLYKINDSPFVLRFTPHTLMSPIEIALSIERMKFMLRKVDHLQALANTNLELPDVVGQIRFLQGPNLYDPTSTQRLVIRFRVAKHVTIFLSLWDDNAATFCSHLCTENQLHLVMIVSTVNPKPFRGEFHPLPAQSPRLCETAPNTLVSNEAGSSVNVKDKHKNEDVGGSTRNRSKQGVI